MSYIDPDNDWIPKVARAALDGEYNRPCSWAALAAEGSEAAQAEVEIWKRLANDYVMRDVYKNLEDLPGFDEHRLAEFIDAAWGARMGSLTDIRKGHAGTLKLASKIGKNALELKALIDQIDGSMMAPSELLSVVSLLRSAEHYQRTPWASMWQGGFAHSALDCIDPHIWNGAPTFSNLLQALAGAAEDWKPELDGAVGAALESRQESPRTEYLRALLSILRDRGFSLGSETSSQLKVAIVGVARVVLGYTEHDVIAHLDKKGEKDRPPMYKDALEKTLKTLLSESKHSSQDSKRKTPSR